MRAVNLLPRDEQRERLQGARTPLIIAAGGVVAVTAFAMLLASSATGSANDRRGELEALEAAIVELPKAQDTAVSQGSLVRERTDRAAALSAALSTRVPFDRLLREISYVLPEDTWLTQPSDCARRGTAPVPRRCGAAPARDDRAAGGSHDRGGHVLARLRRPRARTPERHPVPRERPAHLERAGRAAGDRSPRRVGSSEGKKQQSEAQALRDVHRVRLAQAGSDAMRARVESLSSRTLTIAAFGAVVLYAAVVWLLMVSPKRGEAAEAGAAVAAAEIALAEARATSSRPGRAQGAHRLRTCSGSRRPCRARADQSESRARVEQARRAERRHAPRDRAAGPLSSVGGPTAHARLRDGQR